MEELYMVISPTLSNQALLQMQKSQSSYTWLPNPEMQKKISQHHEYFEVQVQE